MDNPVPSPLRATPLAPLVFEEIPRRDWVVMRRLIRKFVTILFGAGGLNKSSFTMQEAIGVALGRCLNGEPFSVKQSGRVWIYNNEDPIDELRRRLAAICINWNITPGDLQPRLFLDSGLDRRLIVMKQEHRIAIATPDADALAAEIQRNAIDLLIVDPFIRVHQVDENDNPAIDAVIEQFSKIASRCNCCISLVHHGRKTPPGAVKTTGNADNARGASALKDAVRLAHELTEMTEHDAERLGVGDAERPWLIRLDDAKNNMSPPAENAIWFKRKGVLLPNGRAAAGRGPGQCRRAGAVDTAGHQDADQPPHLQSDPRGHRSPLEGRQSLLGQSPGARPIRRTAHGEGARRSEGFGAGSARQLVRQWRRRRRGVRHAPQGDGAPCLALHRRLRVQPMVCGAMRNKVRKLLKSFAEQLRSNAEVAER